MCTSIPFIGEIISRHAVTPDLHALSAFIEKPPKSKKDDKHS